MNRVRMRKFSKDVSEYLIFYCEFLSENITGPVFQTF